MDSQAKGEWLVRIEKLTEKQIFYWTQQKTKVKEVADDNVPMNLQEIIDEGRRNLLTSMEFEDEDYENNNHEKKESFSKKNPWKPVLRIRKKQLNAEPLPCHAIDDVEEQKKLSLNQMKNSALTFKPQTLIYVDNLEEFFETEAKNIKIEPGTNSKTTFSGVYKGKVMEQKKGINSTGCRKSDLKEKCNPKLPKKKIRFDAECEDESNGSNKLKQRRPIVQRRFDPNADLKPEDITEEMLDEVANNVSSKKYDGVTGTSCHQCRQKTLDRKTICRSGICRGVRGNFCGVCLRNRYGQDAKRALKDPQWCCPPCLGICNCSICRKREGKDATGVITSLAQSRGFQSVHQYLESLRCE